MRLRQVRTRGGQPATRPACILSRVAVAGQGFSIACCFFSSPVEPLGQAIYLSPSVGGKHTMMARKRTWLPVIENRKYSRSRERAARFYLFFFAGPRVVKVQFCKFLSFFSFLLKVAMEIFHLF